MKTGILLALTCLAATSQAQVTCTTMRCAVGYTCMTDTSVNPPKDECVPIQSPPTKPVFLKEGEVCMYNGDVKGECQNGLECRPRDGVQTLVAESVCQQPQIVAPVPPCCAEGG
eukprot:TRINITY_DN258_c0_g1_i11.p2 TRINITY_DN258_c0_g1~~TRINITY_DN258_c0_g1_i11.p2  ORF type:complete len:131 (+),score=36.29 TRINITY_DN258_c0_g1_i11:52-393(+)